MITERDMGEENNTLLDFGPVENKMEGIIKVIGVGGGGCNAVRNMYNEGVDGVSYAVCNTDSQSLSRSPVPVRIMLVLVLAAIPCWGALRLRRMCPTSSGCSPTARRWCS